jgi:hypothetical protein
MSLSYVKISDTTSTFNSAPFKRTLIYDLTLHTPVTNNVTVFSVGANWTITNIIVSVPVVLSNDVVYGLYSYPDGNLVGVLKGQAGRKTFTFVPSVPAVKMTGVFTLSISFAAGKESSSNINIRLIISGPPDLTESALLDVSPADGVPDNLAGVILPSPPSVISETFDDFHNAYLAALNA